MALTKEEREARIKINEMLDRFEKEGKDIFDDEPVNEGVQEKITNMSGLQKLIEDNKDKLIYVGVEPSDIDVAGNVTVSLFLMSTKKVSVPENDNLIVFAFNLEKDYWSSQITRLNLMVSSKKSSTIERFIGLPIVSDKEDAITAKALVNKCDAVQFYKMYLEDALALIRKHFPTSYSMFVGPNLSKHLEYKVISRSGAKTDNTLYVAYDAFRKKFKFSYNPNFILESAINEWMLNKSRYKSLRDCYSYLLAFSITHEMLHIIHHNTVSDTFVDDSRLSAVDGNVANIIMDSFINCKLAKGYRGASAIRSSGSLAPMLSDGVDSKVSVRVEHNRGLKKFNNIKELADIIADSLLKSVGLRDLQKNYGNDFLSDNVRDLSKYEGADIFISVDVNPQFNELRSSSNIFQIFINEVITDITDGKAFSTFSKVSDEEKRSDLDILPDGTLVMIKGMRDIGVVKSHDEGTDKYVINKANLDGVRHPADDIHLNIPVYSDSGEELGIFDRLSIRPYNPENDAYRDDTQKETKSELSQEDLDNVKQKMEGGMQMPPLPQGNEKPAKTFSVGDIVWVRKAQRFGRIVSIDNGKFNIEEMKELPCKVLDRKTVF